MKCLVKLYAPVVGKRDVIYVVIRTKRRRCSPKDLEIETSRSYARYYKQEIYVEHAEGMLERAMRTGPLVVLCFGKLVYLFGFLPLYTLIQQTPIQQTSTRALINNRRRCSSPLWQNDTIPCSRRYFLRTSTCCHAQCKF